MDINKVYDASIDVEMEERNRTECIRDNSESISVGDKKVGKITAYKFTILIRDKPTLTGQFTREEMDLVYRLYASEGSNLQQRTVSRYFPNYTFQDFKRIIRAFNISKASSPVAPHMIEEKSTDELVQLTFQSKENDYLRKLEQDRSRLAESRLKDMTKNYFDLLNQISNFQEFTSTLNFQVFPIQYNKPSKVSDSTIVVYLSDMHIGAEVSGYSVYENTFNFEVAQQRLQDLTQHIITTCINMTITNIVICNLGDSLDGYNGETTRGGHKLPQNMNNKDQYKNFIQLMLTFFTNLSSSGVFSDIEYIAVEGGNHDGDVGYMANKSLEACLGILNPEIEVTIFEKFMDYFVIKDHTFILCHGKDAKDMFKNLPVTLNDKVENQINEFIGYANINTSNIHFIKGDLHQTATTYGKKFRYKSTASFFGSSEWIHKNFGNTLAAVDFDIVNGDNIFETRLILNK